jgi:enterochelin esterase-like enzyme
LTYRNVSLSPERDGLRLLTFRSPALEGRGDVSLFLPEGDDLPLILLLHGVYGSHWSWSHLGFAPVTARDMIAAGKIRPTAIAMPSDGLAGDGTAYINRYERWIIDDVVGCVREVAPSVTGPLLLAGLSMGGYGALRLGAKHADRVRAVSAHSAITELPQLAHFTTDPLPAPEPDHSILHWIDAHPPSSLRFDCGLDDPLLPASRALHRALDERRVPHDYAEFPGGHDWFYWSRHLRDTLVFFDRCR